ncbi:MAG: glycosyl hydrolase [Opitutaceae bacterium]
MKTIFAALLVAGFGFANSAAAQPIRPANPNANAPARAILEYLAGLEQRADKRMLSGQFMAYGDNATPRLAAQIHQQSGHWPAVIGVDFADYPRHDVTFAVPIKTAIDYWKQGGLANISAHLFNPANPDPAKAQDGGLRDKGVDLDALLTPGTASNETWMALLDRIAAALQELEDAGVVAMWRPFHEMNGNWFWWGGHEPEKFVRLWRHMFDYFTKTKELDNLLWVYGPNHGNKTAAYYPGDSYADIVGLDAYTDFVDPEHIKGYDEIAKIKKPFGFTEFGPHGASNPPGNYDYRRFVEGVQKHFPRTVFFMSWNDGWSLGRNHRVKELLEHPWTVNREDLPNGLVRER